MTEVAKWLKGLMEIDDSKAPDIFSNCFGVRHKEKMRCVGQPQKFTTFAEERISLHSADVMASAMVEWCDARDAAEKRDVTAKSLKMGFQPNGGFGEGAQESGLGHQGHVGLPEGLFSAFLRQRKVSMRSID